MKNKILRYQAFVYFLTLTLWKQKVKHTAAVFISILIIFLLSAVLFVSSSLKQTLLHTVKQQGDFTVTRLKAGYATQTPSSWIEQIEQIEGVTALTTRVHGRYFYQPKGKSFLVVGIDFFDEQNSQLLEALIGKMALKSFLSQESMVVGQGVKNFLTAHFYEDTFSFKTPSGAFKEVHIAKQLDESTNLIANDMVIMPIALAREIFGFDENEVSDITFNVPNEAEWDTIITKLHLLFYDVRILDKREIQKGYENMFNYKGGVFLILYLVTLLTFMLILYQRYAMVYSSERKEIGTLRAVGWSIKEILLYKFYENVIIVMVSFTVGVLLAYGYVFLANAPFLKAIFLGNANLSYTVGFTPVLELGLLGSLFLLYAIPFLVAVLIPAWKIAVTPPKEAMQ